jgi:PadR family transcriptional regulator PadR
MAKRAELAQGTLESTLKPKSLGPLHGYGILLPIQQISGEIANILRTSPEEI